jgi:hypothetical protein
MRWWSRVNPPRHRSPHSKPSRGKFLGRQNQFRNSHRATTPCALPCCAASRSVREAGCPECRPGFPPKRLPGRTSRQLGCRQDRAQGDAAIVPWLPVAGHCTGQWGRRGVERIRAVLDARSLCDRPSVAAQPGAGSADCLLGGAAGVHPGGGISLGTARLADLQSGE